MVINEDTFFERLFYFLDLKNWSIAKLSCEAQISENTIHAFIKRRNIPTFNVCKKICDALGVTMLEFLNDEPTEFDKEQTLRFIFNEEIKKVAQEQCGTIEELTKEIQVLNEKVQKLMGD